MNLPRRQKSRAGRPSRGNQPSSQVSIRVTDEERTAWLAVADAVPLSEWIRATCNAAVLR